jgi:hypothetical protein
MTRRQPQQGDSLEMLLDTMCNTFGGIILIALLIALLARETKVSEAESRRVTESGGVLERQIEAAEKELARTKQLQKELEARTANPAQTGALRLIEERERLRQKSALLDDVARASADAARAGTTVSQEQVIAQMQAMAATNREAEQKLIEQRNLGTSLQGRLEELKSGLQLESNRLAQVTEQQTQQTRPPQEHETTNSHLYIIMRYGRMYPLYLFHTGQPVQNATSLRWTQRTPTTRLVEPIAGAGLDPVGGEAAIAQFLRELRTDRVYLIFELYEDSFAAFNKVKPMVARQRLEYTWEGRRNDEPTLLGPGPLPPPPQ